MNSPKEKAKELVNKYLRIEDTTTFYWNGYYDQRMFDEEVLPHAKKCAIIAVDEIMKLDVVWYQGSRTYDFYEEVKQEIEKL